MEKLTNKISNDNNRQLSFADADICGLNISCINISKTKISALNILFALFILLSSSNVFANDAMKITGDIMRMDDGLQIIEGRFRGEKEGYVLTADKAVLNEEMGMVTAISNVRLVQDAYVLTCGTLVIYIDEDRAIASDNPKVIERVPDGAPRQSVLQSLEIESFQSENRVIARGNVVLTQKSLKDRNSAQVSGPSSAQDGDNAGSNSEETATASSNSDGTEGEEDEDDATKKPDKGDPRMYADFLEMFMNEGRSVAKGNVKITDDVMSAYGERAVYFERDEKLILVGGAWAEQNTGDKVNTVTGDKIIYFMNTDRIIITSAIAEMFPATDASKED